MFITYLRCMAHRTIQLSIQSSSKPISSPKRETPYLLNWLPMPPVPALSTPVKPLVYLLCLFWTFHIDHISMCFSCAKSLQLWPTLCDPMDCSFSVHGMLQTRILEWVIQAYILYKWNQTLILWLTSFI